MALAAAGLQTSIWNNNIRSVLLLASYPLLIAGLAWAVAAAAFLTFLGPPPDGVDLSVRLAQAGHMGGIMVWEWLPTILTVVALWFVVSFFFHTKMVRMLSHARPVTRAEEPDLYNLLENLCIARGLSVPRLEVIESPALNAYASGIDDKSYAITVTRGLMQTLAPDELEGVLAHELTHIINRDVRLMIVSVIFVGMVGFTAQMFWSMIRYNLYAPRRRDSRGNGGVLIFILVVGAVLWLGYMATLFTRFALSRRREFMADAGAVELTRNPEAMMRALMRIAGHDRMAAVPDDIALMCIENSRPFFGLFATHPPIVSRIKALSDLTGTPEPVLSRPSVPDDAAPESADRPRNPWRRRNPWA